MKSKKLIKIVSLALLGATVMTVAPMTANAAWKQNSTGWWYTEGSSWATGWRQINGVWYFFDGNGYMKTGWVKDNGIWYYLRSSGAMATGWVNDGGTWYFLGSSGAMKTGWIKDNGIWYYLKASGAMASNEIIEYKNSKYSLEASGAMTIGWKNINSDTYYFNEDGDAAKGNKKIGDANYYFSEDACKLMRNYKAGDFTTDENGKITKTSISESDLRGFQKINGKTYYYEDGKKAVGITSIRNGMDFDNYYFDKDGVMQTGWITDSNKKYYADENGVLTEGASKVEGKLYFFKTSLQVKPGLHDYNKEYRVYIKEDGTLYTGWKRVGGETYYFDDKGMSVSGLVEVGGKKYYFNNDDELQCNLNNYGISTNSKGEVIKFNDKSAKEDVLKNDSKGIKELKDKYGEINISYKGFKDLDNFLGHVKLVRKDEEGYRKTLGTDVDVFAFEVKANVNGKEKVVGKYYVSTLTGDIYGEKEEEKHKLLQIKDNKIVSKYDIEDITL